MGEKARKLFGLSSLKWKRRKKKLRQLIKKGVTERSLVFYKVDQEKVTFN